MRPLSNDLRERVIYAVDSGMTRRAAAERFDVAVSTAIRMVDRWRQSCSHQPRPQGGDKRSQHIEAHAAEILTLVEANKDITLAEIATHLGERHDRTFAPSTIWRLPDRHGMTFKKPRTPPNSKGPTFWRADVPGSPANSTLAPIA